MDDHLQLATEPDKGCYTCTHYYHFTDTCGLKARADAGLTPTFVCQYEAEDPIEQRVDLWLAQLRFNFLEELKHCNR